MLPDQYAPYFHDWELKCPCCGEIPDTIRFHAFMAIMMKLRRAMGFAFIVGSGYRCPKYNDSLYKGDGTHLNGPHTKGAMDVQVAFIQCYRLIGAATNLELGIGARQKGPIKKRMVHLDDLGARFWTY